MKKICVVLVQNAEQKNIQLYNQLFYDLIREPDSHVLYDQNLKGFWGAIAKSKFQMLSLGSFNFLLKDKYELGSFLRENAREYDSMIVLFLNTTVASVRYPPSLLKNYRRGYSNVRFIMLFLDSANRGVSKYAVRLCECKVFDLIYTFDLKDAEERGWKYWRTPYSRTIDEDVVTECDLYFAGFEQNRKFILLKVLDTALAKLVRIKMDIVLEGKDSSYEKYGDNVTIAHGKYEKDYPQILRETMKANCVLEIMRKGQTGFTLRPYEAVVYGKKLLTNNTDIFSFPYYDPQFMKYFERVEDIDWGWVTRRDIVDYQYKEDFSPIKWIEDIQERL